MTVETVLLMVIVVTILGSMIHGPKKSFLNAGPKLGARVEYHLTTGDGFADSHGKNQWHRPQ